MSADQNSEGTSQGPAREDGPGSEPAPKTRRIRTLKDGLLADIGGRVLWEGLKWVAEQILS
ncbi:hypothetical protein [Rhodococcus triatomae]